MQREFLKWACIFFTVSAKIPFTKAIESTEQPKPVVYPELYKKIKKTSKHCGALPRVSFETLTQKIPNFHKKDLTLGTKCLYAITSAPGTRFFYFLKPEEVLEDFRKIREAYNDYYEEHHYFSELDKSEERQKLQSSKPYRISIPDIAQSDEAVKTKLQNIIKKYVKEEEVYERSSVTYDKTQELKNELEADKQFIKKLLYIYAQPPTLQRQFVKINEYWEKSLLLCLLRGPAPWLSSTPKGSKALQCVITFASLAPRLQSKELTKAYLLAPLELQTLVMQPFMQGISTVYVCVLKKALHALKVLFPQDTQCTTCLWTDNRVNVVTEIFKAYLPFLTSLFPIENQEAYPKEKGTAKQRYTLAHLKQDIVGVVCYIASDADCGHKKNTLFLHDINTLLALTIPRGSMKILLFSQEEVDRCNAKVANLTRG